MRFGSKIILRRGSNYMAMNLRAVKATLIGAYGHQIKVRLDEDDPRAHSHTTPNGIKVGPNAKGDVGWWERSAIVGTW